MNNKGFTLIETLAVIVLLGIVLAIGGYSVTGYLSDSKNESLKIFKENIKSGIINYYNECRYMPTTGVCDSVSVENVTDDDNNLIGYKLETTIGDLADNGFLENQGNNEETGRLIIKDPVTDDDISGCRVSITYSSTDKEFGEVIYSDSNCGSLKD